MRGQREEALQDRERRFGSRDSRQPIFEPNRAAQQARSFSIDANAAVAVRKKQPLAVLAADERRQLENLIEHERIQVSARLLSPRPQHERMMIQPPDRTRFCGGARRIFEDMKPPSCGSRLLGSDAGQSFRLIRAASERGRPIVRLPPEPLPGKDWTLNLKQVLVGMDVPPVGQVGRASCRERV